MRFEGLEIRPMRKSDSAKPYHDYICELIEENTHLLMDKKPTLNEEKKWLKEKLKAKSRNEDIYLGAWQGKMLVGSCEARKGRYKERNNIAIGIAIRKSYRGKGLGGYLIRRVIALAKKKLKPKNIYLYVSNENVPAKSLYKKVGFREFARFPKWELHNGRYIDSIYMLLKM